MRVHPSQKSRFFKIQLSKRAGLKKQQQYIIIEYMFCDICSVIKLQICMIKDNAETVGYILNKVKTNVNTSPIFTQNRTSFYSSFISYLFTKWDSQSQLPIFHSIPCWVLLTQQRWKRCCFPSTFVRKPYSKTKLWRVYTFVSCLRGFCHKHKRTKYKYA